VTSDVCRRNVGQHQTLDAAVSRNPKLHRVTMNIQGRFCTMDLLVTGHGFGFYRTCCFIFADHLSLPQKCCTKTYYIYEQVFGDSTSLDFFLSDVLTSHLYTSTHSPLQFIPIEGLMLHEIARYIGLYFSPANREGCESKCKL
jgi:hypothetical protein